MGFRIQNNIAAMVSNRHLNTSQTNMNKSLERLSSGFRINSASDDAAGLASSMRFRAELSALKVASRNAAEATSLLQVTEGAMSQIELILVRMKELATQASSGNSGSDLTKINSEAEALTDEITRIVGFTEYDGRTLLDGTFGTVAMSSTDPTDFSHAQGIENIDITGAQADTTYFVSAMSASANTITLSDGTVSQQVDYSDVAGLDVNEDFVLDFSQLGIKVTVNSAFEGATGDESFTADLVAGAGTSKIHTGPGGISTFQLGETNDGYNKLGFNLPNLMPSALQGGGSFDIDLTSQGSAQAALGAVSTAIDTLASARADVGALLNRIQYTQSNLAVSIENKTASESVIRDVDMANEMSEFTKNNILVQSGVSMLAQANQVPQSMLKLLA